MKHYFYILLLVVFLLSVGCESSEPEQLSKRQLRSLMIDSLNNSSEGWWYLGSNDGLHYILIKRPAESRIYTVLDKEVLIKLEKFKYAANQNKRSKLKLSKIKLLK